MARILDTLESQLRFCLELELAELPYVQLEDYETLPDEMGLYFVFKPKALLYVGQAQSLLKRWCSGHHRYGNVELRGATKIAYATVECDKEILNVLERALINVYCPVFNDLDVIENLKEKIEGLEYGLVAPARKIADSQPIPPIISKPQHLKTFAASSFIRGSLVGIRTSKYCFPSSALIDELIGSDIFFDWLVGCYQITKKARSLYNYFLPVSKEFVGLMTPNGFVAPIYKKYSYPTRPSAEGFWWTNRHSYPA